MLQFGNQKMDATRSAKLNSECYETDSRMHSGNDDTKQQENESYMCKFLKIVAIVINFVMGPRFLFGVGVM